MSLKPAQAHAAISSMLDEQLPLPPGLDRALVIYCEQARSYLPEHQQRELGPFDGLKGEGLYAPARRLLPMLWNLP